MRNKKIWLNITVLIFYFIVFATTANISFAVTIPSFPSCLNPQGSVIAQYQSGIHGVPGDSNAYTGTDIVYHVTENTILQCLCPPSGNGIQTNWWKLPEFTSEDVEDLKSKGWIYIPNGAAWGLDEAPYMAKNITYSCIGGNGGSSSRGSSSGGSVGGVSTSQGAGQILGLATTGNLVSIYGFSLLGIIFLCISVITVHVYSRKNK